MLTNAFFTQLDQLTAAEYRIYRRSVHHATTPTQIGEVSHGLSYTDSTGQNGGR